MKVGEVRNGASGSHGKPLDGVRILSLEQMQALPFATQLLARLGAEVVKVEHPATGDLGRGSLPAMADPSGRSVGATFVRNNLGKRSIAVDLKAPAGRQLVLDLAPGFDIVCENFKGGALARLGLDYDDFLAVHRTVIYASISGFGNTTESPYGSWPAYATVAEAMSGMYEWKRPADGPPVVNPSGALGDIGTSLFGTIGILAALRHRDRTGEGQRLDVAMFDSMVAFADVVVNFWSMGDHSRGDQPNVILDGFQADDGWFVLQVNREHEFARLAELVGHPEWLDDERFATRPGWRANIDSIRDAVNGWAAGRTNVDACHAMAAAGVAAGPVLSAEQVIADPHLAARDMIVELDRVDGVDEPVIIPGNPIKLSRVSEGPETRPPWLGEHTDEVLRGELGLTDTRIRQLREEGVIG
jgi:crotonobetainyl-CoA:carnitine CoA-transferase CaiB-like acyl-CoA transferase